MKIQKSQRKKKKKSLNLEHTILVLQLLMHSSTQMTKMKRSVSSDTSRAVYQQSDVQLFLKWCCTGQCWGGCEGDWKQQKHFFGIFLCQPLYLLSNYYAIHHFSKVVVIFAFRFLFMTVFPPASTH